MLEEFGIVMGRGGSGVVISSQSGHRLPALTVEQNRALATTPTEELLALPFVQLDQIKDSLHAYQLSKRGNSLRVMAEAVRWGTRGARVNTNSPGIVMTPLAKDELSGPRGEGYRRMIEGSVTRRAGTPDEVGTVGALLMGPEGGFITGSDFLMDGGVTASYWYGLVRRCRRSPHADARRVVIARLGAGQEAMDGADPWHDVWGDRYSERAQRMRAVRTALRAFVSLACSSPVSAALAQQADSTPVRTEIAGAVTVTTKGISTIPTFTLGKPAAIVDLSIRRDRMSLEPQFRYGLDGKPWTFLFWGRYRLLEGDRLRMTIGGHPAISFRATSDSIGGVQREVIVARRYLAGELAPTYALSRHATVGLYWLYSYAVENDVTKHTHYLAMRSVHTIPLSDGFALRLAPQTYYLKLDDLDGLYANGTLTLGRRRLPFSLSTSATTKIRTDIAGDSFIWNVSLTYTIE